MNRTVLTSFTIMCLLSTVVLMGLAFNIQSVRASETIYIRADGSVDPLTAPISSVDNVTYTFTDNINSDTDGIVIERNNIILDGNGYTLQGTEAHRWDSYGIFLSGRSNVTIKNLEINKFWRCVRLNNSSNSNICRNIMGGDAQKSILLSSSSNNIISENEIYTLEGIGLDGSCNNNTMSGNTVSPMGTCFDLYNSSNNIISGNNMGAHSPGVWLHGSSNNVIRGNTIQCHSYGLRLDGSSFNTFSENSITQSYESNVYLGSSSNNTFSGNNITKGELYGIWLSESYNNKFYRNNFIDNAQQVHIEISGYSNFWDNGYPSGGNCWSDLAGTDSYSGPYQNQTGSDGLSDFPYVIDEDNQDQYPLMSANVSFTYSPSNPIAHLTSVVFNASSSIGLKEVITEYYWDFGDGAEGRGVVSAHMYNAHENYNVTLTVVTSNGLSSYLTRLVTVREAPEASFTFLPASNVSVAQPVIFDASSSSPLGGNITSYIWDFGDYNVTSTIDPIVNHTYSSPGIYNVSLSVLDSEGLNSSYSQTVWVRMCTSVSISTSSSSTFVGYKVNVTGTLCDTYGNGLENETVVLHYTFSGISTWTPITSDVTDNLGHYDAIWIPPATGCFTIKAEWNGNTTHLETSNTTTLSSLTYNNQYIFSVESNSTIRELAFNTTNWQLSFTITGPNGTEGYIEVTVAKSLVENITNIRVYLDRNQTEYSITSINDSWFLTFNYIHSNHQAVVDLDINIIPEFPSYLILPLFMLATLLAVIIYGRKHAM